MIRSIDLLFDLKRLFVLLFSLYVVTKILQMDVEVIAINALGGEGILLKSGDYVLLIVV